MLRNIQLSSKVSTTNAGTVFVVCPRCNLGAAFERAELPDLDLGGELRLALRKCADPTCRQAVLLLVRNGTVQACIPSRGLRLEFDGIPDRVKESLRGAQACSDAGCHMAAAMMARKAIECICADQECTGSNLEARIKSLGEKTSLPPDVVEALHNLRFLGNDAAHVDSREYEEIGAAHIEAAMGVFEFLLPYVYGRRAVLEKLESLKR